MIERLTDIAAMQNTPGKISASLDAASRSANRLAKATNRFTLALVLVALAALAFEVVRYLDTRNREQSELSSYHLPVAIPPLEPDRPDLIEEPRITE